RSGPAVTWTRSRPGRGALARTSVGVSPAGGDDDAPVTLVTYHVERQPAVEGGLRAVVHHLPQTAGLGVEEAGGAVIVVLVVLFLLLFLLVLVLAELVLHLLEDLEEGGGRADPIIAELDAALEIDGEVDLAGEVIGFETVEELVQDAPVDLGDGAGRGLVL